MRNEQQNRYIDDLLPRLGFDEVLIRRDYWAKLARSHNRQGKSEGYGGATISVLGGFAMFKVQYLQPPHLMCC
jgi:hypothetical protein